MFDKIILVQNNVYLYASNVTKCLIKMLIPWQEIELLIG